MSGVTHFGDCREVMRGMIERGEKVQMCVTSPPYFGLRDYDVEGQLGLEPSFWEYLDNMVEVFALVWELLEDNGTCWVNMGDSYASSGGAGWQGKNGQRADRSFTAVRDTEGLRNATRRPPHGLKPKDLVGQPWRLAFALQDWGWYLRQDIIWHKPNPMPESVKDRCTKSHEYVFLLSKSERYYFDQDAIKEPCSPDTHPRYARGRGEAHKYADGGPGNQTIARSFEHMQTPPQPTGWDMSTGEGGHGTTHRDGRSNASPKYRESGGEHRTKSGLAAAERKSRQQKKDRSTPKDFDGRSERMGRGKGGRKLAEPGEGTKNNSSFDAAMVVMPDNRNRRSVWTVASEPYSGAHFATFPQALIEPCILAGSRPGDMVLDPFFGSGTTGQVCNNLGRDWVGIELNREYEALQKERTAQAGLPL